MQFFLLSLYTAMAAPIITAAPVSVEVAVPAFDDIPYHAGFSETSFPIVNRTADAIAHDESPTTLSTNNIIEKRDYQLPYPGPRTNSFYFCKASDFDMQEGCQEHINVQQGTCYNLSQFFVDNIDSVKTGEGIMCDLYASYNCDTNQQVLYASSWKKESKRLNHWGMNDKMKSYRCYPGSVPGSV